MSHRHEITKYLDRCLTVLPSLEDTRRLVELSRHLIAVVEGLSKYSGIIPNYETAEKIVNGKKKSG